jgi:cytochrome P450
VTDGEVGFDPFLPESHADPYPFYRRRREADPVHQSALGRWVLTRHDDGVTCLRDPRFGRDGFELLLAQFGEGSGESLPRSMPFRDPPDHTRLPTSPIRTASSSRGPTTGTSPSASAFGRR